MMGKYEEALPLHRKALGSSRQFLGDNHPVTLNSINNMGDLLQAMGRNEEALPYFREGLAGCRRLFGHEHPDTLTLTNNMGNFLNELGRHDGAADLLLEGEATARKVWTGDRTRWLGNYLAKLGEARTGQGAFAEAETTLLEAHGLIAAGFGDDHPGTTKTIKRIISLYESWHAAEPGKGYDAKAAEWRAKLPKEEMKEDE